MDNGKVAVAQCFCACTTYDTMITQKTDLMTLCSWETLFAGTHHLIYYFKPYSSRHQNVVF